MGNLIEINIEDQCNARCIYCVRGNTNCSSQREQYCTENNLKKIINAKKKGFSKLILQGGEPTIRKDIFKLTKKAKEIGFESIIIISNGIMFYYPKFTRKLKKAGLTSVTLSVNGPTAKIHDSITNVKGSFDYLIRGIKNLQKEQVNLNA